MKYKQEAFDTYCEWLKHISNELAEQNRLKQIEIGLKIIEMQGSDPEQHISLGKEDAHEFMTKLQDEENVV